MTDRATLLRAGVLAGGIASATLGGGAVAGGAVAWAHDIPGRFVASPLPPAVLLYGGIPEGALAEAGVVYRYDAPVEAPAAARAAWPEGQRRVVVAAAAGVTSPALFRGLDVIVAPGLGAADLAGEGQRAALQRAVEVQGAGRGIWLRQLPLWAAAAAVAGVSAAAAWLAGRTDPRRHAWAIALWTVGCVAGFWLARRAGWDLPWGLIAGPAVAPLWVALWEEIGVRSAARGEEHKARSGVGALSEAVRRLLPEHVVLVVDRAGGSSILIPPSLSGDGRMPLPQALSLVAASPDREQLPVRQRGAQVATLTVSGRPLQAAELEAVQQLLYAVEAAGGRGAGEGEAALRLEWGAIRDLVERQRHRLSRIGARPAGRPEGRTQI